VTPLRSHADAAQKDISQDDRIVVRFIVSRKDERYLA
jgi:hypothetical protein